MLQQFYTICLPASSVDLSSYDAAQSSPQSQHPLIGSATPRPHHAFAALSAVSEVCSDLTLAQQYSYAAPR